MRSRRTLQVCLAAIAALVAMAQFLPGTSSSFTASTSNSGSSVTAVADWTGPTVGATAIQKSQGGIADTIKQGGTFYVYANATDSGNPASGVASLTASVANVATVSTATMTAGSYTVGGTSYAYRSALLTAKATLASSSYSYSVSATDSAGNTGSAAADTVTVDNTTFDGDNFTWTDNGTAGRFDSGDVARFVFTKTVDPDSIVDGWDGSSYAVKVALYDAAVYFTGSDILAVGNTALTAQLPLGTAYLGGDYVAAGGTVIFNATMSASGNTVSVTLGTIASGSASVKTATLQSLASWTEMATPFDAAGNVAGSLSLPQFGRSSFAATNKTFGTTGKPETGDRVAFTYSDVPLLSSIVSGWSSGSQTVMVKMTDKSVNGTTSDQLSVYNSSGSTLLPLGIVALNGDHVTGGTTLTFSNSTMTASGSTVYITLGTANSTSFEHTDSATHKPIWTPDDAVTDPYGAGSSTIPTNPSTSTVQF
jgi:hypothetical protein